MFLDVDAESFGLIGHAEGHVELAQSDCDHKGPRGGQSVGHQDGLELTQDQREPSVFGQDGSSWMGGNQRCAGEDAGQQRAHRATDAMDGEGVEGVVKTQVHLEPHRGILSRTEA